MKRSQSTEDVVNELKNDIQVKTKLIAAYQIKTPEFDKLVPEHYGLEIKKFLILKAINDDITTTPVLKPSRALDDLWIKFMTCIIEYMNFCESILQKNTVIQKISFEDTRNNPNGFKKAIHEFEKYFPQPSLSSDIWNLRHKDVSYDELSHAPQAPKSVLPRTSPIECSSNERKYPSPEFTLNDVKELNSGESSSGKLHATTLEFEKSATVEKSSPHVKSASVEKSSQHVKSASVMKSHDDIVSIGGSSQKKEKHKLKQYVSPDNIVSGKRKSPVPSPVNDSEPPSKQKKSPKTPKAPKNPIENSSLLISHWKDSSNRNIYDMCFDSENKIYKSTKKNILDEVKSEEGNYILYRDNKYIFNNLLLLLDVHELQKVGITNIVKKVCNEMDVHLSQDRKCWDVALFLDFTHVLIQYKWFKNPFPDSDLEKKYDKLCKLWFDKYGTDVINEWNKINTKTKLKTAQTNILGNLDLTLQFLKLMNIYNFQSHGVELHEFHKLQGKICYLIKNDKHNIQTEHLYLMTLLINRDLDVADQRVPVFGEEDIFV